MLLSMKRSYSTDLSGSEWGCLKPYVLLASVGFREVGAYEKHVRLDGEWRGVVIVERLIPANPAPFNVLPGESS